MLVLSRKAQEVILIGNDIKVMVVRINGGVVSLGIDAPKDVVILREEIAERNERES